MTLAPLAKRPVPPSAVDSDAFLSQHPAAQPHKVMCHGMGHGMGDEIDHADQAGNAARELVARGRLNRTVAVTSAEVLSRL